MRGDTDVQYVVKNRKKAWRPKAKTGCLTCRRRRVKCDESRPTCNRCTKGRYVCDGYEREEPTACKVVLELIANSADRRSVQYFWERTRHEYAPYYVRAFFQSTAPQGSQSHPAILHALVAVAAQHEYMESPESQWRIGERPDTFAMRHYQKAIKALVQPSNQMHISVEVMLASCLLLFFYDMMRYDHKASIVHLMGGMKMLEERKPAGTDSDRDQTVATMSKIMEAAYFTVESAGQGAEMLMQLIWDQHVDTPDSGATVFSIHEDQRLGGAAYDWMLEFIDEIESVLIIGKQAQQHAPSKRHTFDSLWLKSYIALTFYGMVCKGRAKPDRSFVDAARVPGMHHAVPAIMFGALQQKDETRYDGLIDQFQAILEDSRATIKAAASNTTTGRKGSDVKEKVRAKTTHGFLSPSVNIIAPLYLTAVKCREPQLRRQAISLLRACPPQLKGLWDGALAADIAQAVLQIEERGLGVVESPKDIPKTSRVVVDRIIHNSITQEVRIQYKRFQQREANEVFEETVPCQSSRVGTGPLSWPDLPEPAALGMNTLEAFNQPLFTADNESFQQLEVPYRNSAKVTVESLPHGGYDSFNTNREEDVANLGWSANIVTRKNFQNQGPEIDNHIGFQATETYPLDDSTLPDPYSNYTYHETYS
ncbi:MAG: hypothetical protein Q9160_002853 [Pyrenula sp. 1 TL-2023]